MTLWDFLSTLPPSGVRRALDHRALANVRNGRRILLGSYAWDRLANEFPDVDWIPWRCATFPGAVTGDFGKAVLRLMAEKNMNTDMLATQLGMHVTTIGHWLRGEEITPSCYGVIQLKSLYPQVDWIGLASAQAEFIRVPVGHLPPDSWMRSYLSGIVLESAVAEGTLTHPKPQERAPMIRFSLFSPTDGWALGTEETRTEAGGVLQSPILLTRAGVKRGETAFVFERCRWEWQTFDGSGGGWVLHHPEGEKDERFWYGLASHPDRRYTAQAAELGTVQGMFISPFWFRAVVAAEWPHFFREWIDRQRAYLLTMEQMNIPAPRD